jgi:methyltransferase-like protein
LFAGIVSISVSPGNYTLDIAEKPYASKLARYQALNGKMVTNQRHETVMLNSAEKILIQYLDGFSDMDHIAKKICGHIETEELVMEINGNKISDPMEQMQSSRIICESIIKAFAENALLCDEKFTEGPDG